MSIPEEHPARLLSVEITVDASRVLAGLRGIDRDFARILVRCWRRRYDPNPFPHFRLFRWLP